MKARSARSAGKQAARPKRQVTTVSFTAEELTAMGRLMAAGIVVLQTSHRVKGKLKAALSRLGLASPQGL